MRDAFRDSLLAFASRPDLVFLTGDLGFRALEPLRAALGERFLNAGVAEQNMVSVGAGLAKAGLRPWLYSIAPFLYARPFEQIRNDVGFHRLPVVLVGNGGGYSYGVMGATHHALEDYGSLLCLPHLRAYLPAFDWDVFDLVPLLLAVNHPAYLRLGLSEVSRDEPIPPFAPWRKLLDGEGWTVVVAGPLVGGIWRRARALKDRSRPSLWLVSELPPDPLPEAFLADLTHSGRLLVVEEHVEHGGCGMMLAASLAKTGLVPPRFALRPALRYPSGLYGSQAFHRRESGLDAESIVAFLAADGAGHDR